MTIGGTNVNLMTAPLQSSISFAPRQDRNVLVKVNQNVIIYTFVSFSLWLFHWSVAFLPSFEMCFLLRSAKINNVWQFRGEHSRCTRHAKCCTAQQTNQQDNILLNENERMGRVKEKQNIFSSFRRVLMSHTLYDFVDRVCVGAMIDHRGLPVDSNGTASYRDRSNNIVQQNRQHDVVQWQKNKC